ncbi:unnamed protein product, partial [Cylindrotheca closterium]
NDNEVGQQELQLPILLSTRHLGKRNRLSFSASGPSHCSLPLPFGISRLHQTRCKLFGGRTIGGRIILGNAEPLTAGGRVGSTARVSSGDLEVPKIPLIFAIVIVLIRIDTQQRSTEPCLHSTLQECQPLKLSVCRPSCLEIFSLSWRTMRLLESTFH